MSVQVSVKKQFVMGIVIILIFLAGVEGTVRGWEFFALGCNPSESDAYEDMNYFSVRQICLDVRFLQFIDPDVVSNKPDQHLVTINTNSYGIRGPEFPMDKPDNTYRIIIVGGSTTFGHGASSDDTTIPAFIQKKFNEKNMPMNVHVINAGVNSLYSFTEVYHIKNKLMKFEPDLRFLPCAQRKELSQNLTHQTPQARSSRYRWLEQPTQPYYLRHEYHREPLKLLFERH